MPIDFHDEKNRLAYATRHAHDDWKEAVRSLVDVRGMTVADIGCGGGIYVRALCELGAGSVVGVDSSAVMLAAAMEQCRDWPNVRFVTGDAAATGLSAGSIDLVLARALIHHLKDLDPFLDEARRILRRDGWILIQDRTPEDVALRGTSEHIRGYFFERFPRLLPIDLERRWDKDRVLAGMVRAGFSSVRVMTVWETRRIHPSFETLAEDIRHRSGRSLLHELDDREIEDLIAFLRGKLAGSGTIVEKDRWTLWVGRLAK